MAVAPNLWLCIDPGNMTGWSVWAGQTLLGGGQTPMWEFAEHLWDFITLAGDDLHFNPIWSILYDVGLAGPFSLDLIVCENFQLYPWKAKELSWDEFHTVRLIGAIYFMCLQSEIPMEFQAAKIKERALAGGAKELFVSPLHENRHQNDSIMHGLFYVQTVILGNPHPQAA